MSFNNLEILYKQNPAGFKISFDNKLETAMIVSISRLMFDSPDSILILKDAVRDEKELLNLISHALSNETE